MSDPIISILLVHDHASARPGLRAALERAPDLRVVAEASSEAEALAVVARARPDVVLLDLGPSPAPDTQDVDLRARLLREHPALGVLRLTGDLGDPLVADPLVADPVPDVDTSVVASAVRAVSGGGTASDPGRARTVGAARLTERQLEVLRLLAQGLSNRDIGGTLFIAETTVKFHVSNILRALAVSRRAEAVSVAGELGFI